MSGASVRVPRDVLDTIGILRESVVRNDAMRLRLPAYGSTSLEMNDVGLFGEHAVRYFLSGQGAEVSLTSREDYRNGDLEVFRPHDGSDTLGVTHRLEVKTSRVRHWRRYERSLNESQLQRMTSVLIVWCVVPDDLGTAGWVDVEGWLPLRSVLDSDTSEALILHGQRHRRIHEPMRAPADLLPWLDGLGLEPDPPF